MVKKIVLVFLSLFLINTFAGHKVFAKDKEGFLKVTSPCDLEFPRDHGPHPGYRTEWWYYTGNLVAASKKKYGFQLTFFRSQISPPGERQKWPQPASAWRTQQIYLAHSAISNITEKKHLKAERVSRGALNMAGANQVDGATIIFLNNWSAQIEPDRHLLIMQSDLFSYELELIPEKPVVRHGIDGYSRKGSTADQATCYYSFTRLNTKGKLSIGENEFAVRGLAWMDHEYGTDIFDSELKGWDWFSLQLSDHTEVMVAIGGTDKGGLANASNATVVGKNGQSQHIRRDEFLMTVRDTWTSPHTKAVYPAGWQLQIFPSSIDLSIKPNLADQEMLTSRITGEIYWEGSVSVKGTKEGQEITGHGYVELTGYARPFDAPM